MNQQGVSPIGQQVARYRKTAKISGEELAERAGEGLTRSIIANLENGRKWDVTVSQLLAIAAVLHVPPVLLIADVFDPGGESPYPMPDFESVTFDSKSRELVNISGYSRNSELIAWVGAHSFRSPYPVEQPATKLADMAYSAVQTYLRAGASFTAAAARYSSAMDSDQEDFKDMAEEVLQREALYVMSAIEGMKRVDVKISDEPEAHVYKTLSDLGLTYSPDFGNMYELPDSDG